MNEKETLKIMKSGLIVVDMVNGFIRGEGALVDPHIQNIIAENVRLVKEFLERNEPVIAIKDCHTKDSLEIKYYPDKGFPSHCLEGTYEAELVDELKIYEPQFKVFKKDSTSGFTAPGFQEYIKNMNDIKEWVISGCCTDICDINLGIPLKCFFNQLKRDVNIVVPENAVDTYNAPWHNREEWTDMAFKFMKQAGIEVVKKYERK